MSKKDLSLKEFEEWLSKKDELIPNIINEYIKTNKEPRLRYIVIKTSPSLFGTHVVVDTQQKDKYHQIVAIFHDELNHEAKVEADKYAEYLNNKEDD